MESLHAERRRFDVVVIDPPAFIKRKKDIPKGEAAYKRLNQLAMQLLERDGILVSCSCSYHLEPQQLWCGDPARGAPPRRFAQIVEVGGQSPDHPDPPGDSRDALSQGVLLPHRARLKLPLQRCNCSLIGSTMIAYPSIDPIIVSIGPFGPVGPLAIRWYGLMYVIGFAVAWWLGAATRSRSPVRPGRPPTSTM